MAIGIQHIEHPRNQFICFLNGGFLVCKSFLNTVHSTCQTTSADEISNIGVHSVTVFYLQDCISDIVLKTKTWLRYIPAIGVDVLEARLNMRQHCVLAAKDTNNILYQAKPPGYGPWHTTLGIWVSLSSWLGSDGPKGPFQPQPFCEY